MDINLIRWLSTLDSELAHRLGLTAAWFAGRVAPRYLHRKFGFHDPILHQNIWGIEFSNPVGLAAGCDKNALVLPFWDRLGFGHVEVGSVTAAPSRGNPRPRLFRLQEDQAIINRLGLPSKGARRVAKRLSHASVGRMAVGVSIASLEGSSSVIGDYYRCVSRLLPYPDYLTINISCPNTENGKSMEMSEHLDVLLEDITGLVSGKVPILIKLSPLDTSRVIYDSQIETILDTAIRHGVNGFVVANTVSDRSGLVTDSRLLDEIGQGGLSGPPIYDRALQMIRYVHSYAGPNYPIVGVGGISTAEDAYRMICAGASLLQLYTALIYRGPGIVQRIKRGLVDILRSDGHTSISSAVGTQQGLS